MSSKRPGLERDRADRERPAPTAASQATGRQRGDGQVAVGEQQQAERRHRRRCRASQIHSPTHADERRPAPRVAGSACSTRRRRARSESRRSSSSQPIALRGCREATSAPTVGEGEHEQHVGRRTAAQPVVERRRATMATTDRRRSAAEIAQREPPHVAPQPHRDVGGLDGVVRRRRAGRRSAPRGRPRRAAARRTPRACAPRRSGGGRSAGRPRPGCARAAGRNSAATASVETATAKPELPDREPDQQHQREVGGAERDRERGVDQRAPDHDVDVVEPVAQDRDAGRDRERDEAEQAEDERGVGDACPRVTVVRPSPTPASDAA